MDVNSLNVIKLIIIIVMFIVIALLIRQSKSIRLERRIGGYAITPVNSIYKSLFDNIREKMQDIIKSLNNLFRKSAFLTKASKRYETKAIYQGRVDPMDFITKKIVMGLILDIIYIVSCVIKMKYFNFYGLLIVFFVGYYATVDLYLLIVNKRNKKIIKEQMLRAIILMNNAFKAGKSTLQALKIVSTEVDFPLNLEFEKMYDEMKYGLSVEVVFDRFAKRINISEALYISSSLIVLNKTGGNIVKVFSSIEKNLFEKKKLNDELKNLTVSSNMIVKILTFVPIVFVLIIYFLNPNYFDPLFSSILGYMIIGVIIFMFILYVIILNRIMKVKV